MQGLGEVRNFVVIYNSGLRFQFTESEVTDFA